MADEDKKKKTKKKVAVKKTKTAKPKAAKKVKAPKKKIEQLKAVEKETVVILKTQVEEDKAAGSCGMDSHFWRLSRAREAWRNQT